MNRYNDYFVIMRIFREYPSDILFANERADDFSLPPLYDMGDGPFDPHIFFGINQSCLDTILVESIADGIRLAIAALDR